MFNQRQIQSQYRAQSTPGQNQAVQNNSPQQAAGLNQAATYYNSGRRDQEIGQSYYQNQNNSAIRSQYRGNQYSGASQYAGTGQYAGTMQNTGGSQYGGVSQYGGANQYPGQYSGSATLNTLNNVSSNQFSNQSPGQYNQQNQYSQQNFQTNMASQYGQNNSAQQNAVNQYGAQYASGIQDEDISKSYYK